MITWLIWCLTFDIGIMFDVMTHVIGVGFLFVNMMV